MNLRGLHIICYAGRPHGRVVDRPCGGHKAPSARALCGGGFESRGRQKWSCLWSLKSLISHPYTPPQMDSDTNTKVSYPHHQLAVYYMSLLSSWKSGFIGIQHSMYTILLRPLKSQHLLIARARTFSLRVYVFLVLLRALHPRENSSLRERPFSRLLLPCTLEAVYLAPSCSLSWSPWTALLNSLSSYVCCLWLVTRAPSDLAASLQTKYHLNQHDIITEEASFSILASCFYPGRR